jgi:hypothetical protein
MIPPCKKLLLFIGNNDRRATLPARRGKVHSREVYARKGKLYSILLSLRTGPTSLVASAESGPVGPKSDLLGWLPSQAVIYWHSKLRSGHR